MILLSQMNKKFLGISILGIIAAFAGGFLLANALNKNEIEKLTAENTRLEKQQSNQKTNETELNLSAEEINAKIAEAEKNPNDFAFQKGLGLALYRYAALKQDTQLLEQVSILLDRAYKLNPDDYQVIISVGNISYDLGQIKKDNASNLKAREYYAKALKKNEKDTEVLTDYGMTFLMDESSDQQKAIEQFEKALTINQKNEKALFYMTQAQIDLENIDNANKYLVQLKEVNPNNERIKELESKILQKSK